MGIIDKKEWYRRLKQIFKQKKVLEMYAGYGAYEDSRLDEETPESAFDHEVSHWAD